MSDHDLLQSFDASVFADLRGQARLVANNAYAPYSRFKVGAALLLEGGEIVTGCNVENVSYRLTCCAEQAAVACAVAELGPAIRIQAVAVANADRTAACQPCGACRQTLAEFAGPECLVFYPGKGGAAEECTLGELLPSDFDPATLRQQGRA